MYFVHILGFFLYFISLSISSIRKDNNLMKESVILEQARSLSVTGHFDLCVLGGSCTGVFAAVRAARLGLSVALIEQAGNFGGVAATSLVCVWHSPFDTTYEKQIIGGLTLEVMERLSKRNAVTIRKNNPSAHWIFNPYELRIELDELISEHGITPWLHTRFVSPYFEDGQLSAIIVENNSGRSAIKARFFIDATGNGELCERIGLPTRTPSHPQPSTTCAIFSGWQEMRENVNLHNLIQKHGKSYGIQGAMWSVPIPGTSQFMVSGTRVHEDIASDIGLTQAEIEGRRQVRALHDMLRDHAPDNPINLVGLPGHIGMRQSRHINGCYQLTTEDVLYGKRFDDAIANGSYRVDIHHHDKPGWTFRYLDGREVYSPGTGEPSVQGYWRPKQEIDPTFYQVPYRCLIPQGAYGNLLAAGRFIDADQGANGAIRVMVVMNQTGEAAGTAAWLALKNNQDASKISVKSLRSTLAENGSIIL